MALNDMVPHRRKGVAPETQEQNPFRLLRRELDTIFDNFLHGVEEGPFGLTPDAFTPRIDVRESETGITVSAELPGMDEKEIDVSVNRETLTISGEKREEREEKGKGFYRSERSYGTFSRTIPLPLEIEQDKVSAAFKKGVLTVHLPKASAVAEVTRKITVKTE